MANGCGEAMKQYLFVQMSGCAYGCMNCRQPTRTRMYVYFGADKSAWSHFCFRCSKTAVVLADLADWQRVTRPPASTRPMSPFIAMAMALGAGAPRW